jgi:hypothetical protein
MNPNEDNQSTPPTPPSSPEAEAPVVPSEQQEADTPEVPSAPEVAPTPEVEVAPTPDLTPPAEAPAALADAPTIEAPVAPATPATPSAPAAKKRLPKWVIILLSVIGGLVVLGGIAIAVLIFVVGGALAKPLTISTQFVDAVQAQNSSAAYALTSDAFKDATPETSLKSIIDRVGPLLQGEEKVTGQAVKAVNGVNRAAISYSVDHEGTTYYMLVTLQENDGTWQVQGFQSDDEPMTAEVE